MSERMTRKLVIDALPMAWFRRRPESGRDIPDFILRRLWTCELRFVQLQTLRRLRLPRSVLRPCSGSSAGFRIAALSCQPTQCPSWARYPGPRLQPQPKHSGSSTLGASSLAHLVSGGSPQTLFRLAYPTQRPPHGRERIRVEKTRNKKGCPLPRQRSDATDWFLSGRVLRMPDYIMRRLASKEGREAL
jgi:hypothetical protein